ncbi:antitoxin YezG family protein [Thermoactinomyces intermedius]|jgi:uncharacterized protein (TIGR01741 family)|uniref:Antitoxin YezG family protein n=1 Tax=Thermoactinomyces intermedius TaxID=2024 RepID=A0A8I1ADN9_THEIN|nr:MULTISPECIES: antitoxin YezG family protein [Thermoactinomyces]MBA4548381.1 antitoxin YezG family protein [Thermoactinomyces intermedius]MBA4837566.1 antitoxin YezG family protein [Thermoactinomyces intermedius]MBH8595225.1 antitoxin YezG family protein [Thermoactinomyces intermedius]MBH8601836.1 antitoxin YezG family protein [Thermoactinomyces sp. CICC 23799]
MDTPFETQSEKLYQQIGETIVEMIPEEWEKVYLYGEVNEGFCYSFFYYYPENSTSPVYYMDIPKRFHIDQSEFDKVLFQLFDHLEELWETFKKHDQEPWTNLTLYLDSSGKIKIHFDYEDLSDANPLHRRIIWKYRYLGMIPEEQEDREFLEEYLKKEKEEK